MNEFEKGDLIEIAHNSKLTSVKMIGNVTRINGDIIYVKDHITGQTHRTHISCVIGYAQ